MFAADFATHMLRLEQVFSRLRWARLKLRVDKCCFAHRRVVFIGHTISEAGIEPQDRKLDSVRDWPIPTSISEVRTFVGLVSYYRPIDDSFHTFPLLLRLCKS